MSDMENKTLKGYMMKMSLTSLKGYLGNELVDTLIEWIPENKQIYTKANIIDMILTVHGTSILKKKEFRLDLYKRFNDDTIYSMRRYLPKIDNSEEDKKIIVEYAANTPWKKNELSCFILDVLGLTNDVFDIKKDAISSSETISSYGKFYELLDYQYVIRQKALYILSSDIELPRFLIHMPTGTGKTKTATHIICHHYNFNLKKQGLIIWIAHTTELLQQAYETFCSVWKYIGNGSINTYKLYGNNNICFNEDHINGFMVCGIQKLMALEKNNPDLLNRLIQDASLIVFDEAHKASASETRQIIEKFISYLVPKAAKIDVSALNDTDIDRIIENL